MVDKPELMLQSNLENLKKDSKEQSLERLVITGREVKMPGEFVQPSYS